jgi:hypothetical protein
MSASLHIHAFSPEQLNEDDLACFFSHTLGSDYFLLPIVSCQGCGKQLDRKTLLSEAFQSDDFPCPDCSSASWDFADAPDPCGEENFFCSHREKIYALDTFEVGDVSWLKAGLTDDPDKYIPSLVEKISNLFDEGACPIIDEEVIEKVTGFGESEGSIYTDVSANEEITNWLRTQIGKRAFTVSW